MAASTQTALRSWAQAHARTVARKAAGQRTSERRGPLSLAASWRTAAGPVRSLALAPRPDGQVLLAAGGADGGITVWDALEGLEVRDLETGGADPVISLGWLPDAGGLLLTAGTRGWAGPAWNADADEPLAAAPDGPGGREPVGSHAWAVTRHGEPLLATGGIDGSVRLWDAKTGTARRALPGHPRAVTEVAWGTDPHGPPLLASASRDGLTRICDADTGDALHELAGHLADSALAWAPATAAGRRQLAAGGAGEVMIWDGLAGTVLRRLNCEPGRVVSLAWAVSPDGRQVLAAVTDRGDKVWLWDAESWAPLYTLSDRGHVYRAALAAAPDGRFLLATGGNTGDICVWWLDHGPAARPASLAAAAQGSAEAAVEEVAFPGEPGSPEQDRATAVAWAVPADGPPLLATGTANGTVEVWNGRTGVLLHTLRGLSGVIVSVAWAVQPDGQPLLVAGGEDGRVNVWEGRHGTLLGSIDTGLGPINSVALAAPSPGQLLLAAAGERAFWYWHLGQPAAGQLERLSSAWDAKPSAGSTTVALAVLYSSGTVLLAVGGDDGARVLDLADGRTTVTLGTDPVNAVAWSLPADGPPTLATAGQDGAVRVWNGSDGTLLHTLTEPTGPTYSVAWGQLPDGGHLLASAGAFDRRSTRVWDMRTLKRLADLPGAQGSGASLAWALLPDGQTWLTATPGLSLAPRRTWAVRGPWTAAEPRLPAAVARDGLRPAESGLLALGRAGLWPPLGLIADLVTLTGPGKAAALNDDRRRALGAHPGIARLRQLNWPVMSRVSFAGLIARGVRAGQEFVPPQGVTAGALRDALAEAQADDGREVTGHVDPGQLARAADTISDRTVALLTVLGPGAAAADPALPLLLAQHVPKMPALDGRQLRLLQEAGRPGAARLRERDGALRHAPGTAGISRHGSLTRLLPTQLALPPTLFMARYLENELLFRRHLGRVSLVPGPVTIILDTTPPTFGPAENVLRLTAHLMTSVLWEHGQQPVLISLAAPAVPVTLSDPAQLVQLWTSRTLDPPGPAITAAVRTAGDVGAETVLLAHHFAPLHAYLPGPGRRLVTTHHPAEPAPPPPAHPGHFHLPSDPYLEQLVQVVWDVLAPEAGQLPGGGTL